MENTYATLGEALTDIAKRSFYEAADVIPNDDGTFTVTSAAGMVDESMGWTYADGLDAPTGAYDCSRVHEPAEFYDDAAHIRYNLDNAVERLEDGYAVHFLYVVAEDRNVDYDIDGNALDPETGELVDNVVGWALIAFAV